MIRHLCIAASAAIVLTSGAARSAAGPDEGDIVAAAREVLEKPFHFLLKLPGYHAAQFAHDADIFSAWGHLVLVRKDGSQLKRGEVRRKLEKSAKNTGWKAAAEVGDPQELDLPEYGIEERKEDLALQKSSALPGQNPPTRYSCRIWISNDGNRIVAAYRVDGE